LSGRETSRACFFPTTFPPPIVRFFFNLPWNLVLNALICFEVCAKMSVVGGLSPELGFFLIYLVFFPPLRIPLLGYFVLFSSLKVFRKLFRAGSGSLQLLHLLFVFHTPPSVSFFPPTPPRSIQRHSLFPAASDHKTGFSCGVPPLIRRPHFLPVTNFIHLKSCTRDFFGAGKPLFFRTEKSHRPLPPFNQPVHQTASSFSKQTNSRESPPQGHTGSSRILFPPPPPRFPYPDSTPSFLLVLTQLSLTTTFTKGFSLPVFYPFFPLTSEKPVFFSPPLSLFAPPGLAMVSQ